MVEHVYRAVVSVAVGAVAVGALTLGYVTLADEPGARAAPAKNLQVLPKNTDKKQVKAIMKQMTKALGVKCKHCHDTDDMSADTERKQIARDMMRMVNKINNSHLAEMKVEDKVTCKTCHRGKKKPAK